MVCLQTHTETKQPLLEKQQRHFVSFSTFSENSWKEEEEEILVIEYEFGI